MATETKDQERAEELKQEGNVFFKSANYDKAVEKYSAALELVESPIYYSNRAFCHIKLENCGLAVADATRGIELDPRYIKNYYRRGSAKYLLGKYKEALKDFKAVLKIVPNDKDAKRKKNVCVKAVRAEAFAAAIASQHTALPSETVELKSMTIPPSYTGPQMTSPLTSEFVVSVMEWFKQEKLLPKRYVVDMLLQIIELLKTYPTLVDVPIPEGSKITVCGDVHGQYYDVMNIFSMNGLPSPTNPYLFNGDFVDRGSWSVEVIVVFFLWKLLYPNHMHLTRGNHESLTMNNIYGFKGEVVAKYDTQVFDLFTEAFNWLPLGFVLENKIMVVHGGLFSEDGVSLEDIRKTNRFRQPPENGIMCELLWSDPQKASGRGPSKRGVGLAFGPDITRSFLAANGLELLVRSHEVKEEGYEVEADGKLITIFSAPNYCDQMGNKGAFIHFGHDCKPKFTQFEAVPHPNKRPMAYAQQMFM